MGRCPGLCGVMTLVPGSGLQAQSDVVTLERVALGLVQVRERGVWLQAMAVAVAGVGSAEREAWWIRRAVCEGGSMHTFGLAWATRWICTCFAPYQIKFVLIVA